MDAMSDDNLPISIEIDRQKKIFLLSAPVFSGDAALPKAIANYFISLPNRAASALAVNEVDQIFFEEELPFSWGSQPTLRQQFYHFLRRAQRCRHHLRSVAHNEMLGDAQSLLES